MKQSEETKPKKPETVKLSSLVGKHRLSGVDFTTEAIKTYEWSAELSDAQVVRFRLNNKTYLAIENPQDGYRS